MLEPIPYYTYPNARSGERLHSQPIPGRRRLPYTESRRRYFCNPKAVYWARAYEPPNSLYILLAHSSVFFSPGIHGIVTDLLSAGRMQRRYAMPSWFSGKHRAKFLRIRASCCPLSSLMSCTGELHNMVLQCSGRRQSTNQVPEIITGRPTAILPDAWRLDLVYFGAAHCGQVLSGVTIYALNRAFQNHSLRLHVTSVKHRQSSGSNASPRAMSEPFRQS